MAENIPLPHSWDGGGSGSACHLTNRRQELGEARAITHGMVEAKAKEKTTTLEACHLPICHSIPVTMNWTMPGLSPMI
uniref:Uncharacterized protein n=1 Tax=Salix viminalis TaxID=40686 RepID=A0A6N2LER8_SALVM